MRELLVTINTYDKIAEKYEIRYGKIKKSGLPYLHEFIKLLPSSETKILDAGCGTGRDLLHLENFLDELYGVDLSSGMINIAKRKLRKTILIKADITNLPFPDNHFDGVMSVSTLVHLPFEEKKKAISEFWRVLKPSGILYLNIQNLLYLPRLLRCIRHWSRNGVFYDNRYWYFPTKYSMKKLLENNGFTNVRSPSSQLDKRLIFYATK